eukprot:TRINITY_DN774151_c0_g1_i1.p1 TRINITY_DN774151_c0_g1~~TRINITY_DN774151_c0_g1_i1.p1  ORF type:complete len:200 (-),score=38.60 TRINITY_DN774151_c0_g1_i1:172-732(-)
MKLILLLLAIVAIGMCKTQCPQLDYKGNNLIGKWRGYVLTTNLDPAGGHTYFQAMTTMDFTQEGSKLMARVNMTEPTINSHRYSAEACVVDYEVTCLVDTHANVLGFTLPTDRPRPKCVTERSPWRCKLQLTGTAYQDTDHSAAFYMHAKYSGGYLPLRLEPFGQFYTGCGENISDTIQARLDKIN